MKKLLSIVLLSLFITANIFAQYANKNLSNLKQPTAVNISLLPGGNALDLGSANNAWQDLYLYSSVFFRGFQFISANNNTANTFVGINAGKVTTGSRNSFFGDAAGLSNTSGESNSFFGQDAGFSTKTGDRNSFFGESSGFRNVNGNSNSFFGYEAGSDNTSGSNNVFAGNQAGNLNTTGNKNTYVGYHAGNTGTTGSSNTIIGYGADIKGGALNNATAIGNLAVVGASNHIHIGNSSVTLIGGQVGWSQLSDERIKNNIQQNVPGLQFINLLKPVTYHFNLSKQENILGRKDSSNYDGKNDIEKIQFTGFLAQDVEAAAKKINYDFSGVEVPKNDNDLYSLRYSDFVVPLVKAVQELSKQNDYLKNENESLQARVSKLEAMMNVTTQSTIISQQSSEISSARLFQNIPNPFSIQQQ